MNILPELEFYEEIFCNDKIIAKDLLNIIFNENNDFVINREIIDYIENNVHEKKKDLLEAFIKELIDYQRLKSEKSLKVADYINTAKNYYSKCNEYYLTPLTLNKSKFNEVDFLNLINLSDYTKNNYNYIGKELLTKGLISTDFGNYNTDDEIVDFIVELFKIPRNIHSVECFNRDYSAKFLNILKGKKIYYYSLVKREFPANIAEYKGYQTEMKKEVGSQLKIYYTKKRKLIHERKIFIGPLSITFDNAFENICIDEPTWTILIEYNKIKYSRWREKTKEFKLLN
ncbi:hypothetical protein [Riemerella anatipestifer]|uniref:hypothetical protein n=1 Tax=Riemerella anatipestifer TaxID=34085 RepID=UPI00129DC0AE|nr:hypothetical protein [Riemerella anatipestifer]MRM84317.1 hypothetical protein [Riemerella anatipestifer]